MYSHCFNLKSKQLCHYYKILAGFFRESSQKELHQHDITDTSSGEVIEVPILEAQHFGANMCIDDKNIGGEGYTIISNADTGKIAVHIKSCQIKHISKALDKLPASALNKVETITKDLAAVYDWVARQYFFLATRVADKFHVLKLGFEALQAVRVRYRQSILKEERMAKDARKKAKQIGSNKIGDQKQEGKKQEDRKQGSRKPHDAHDIHSTPQFTNTLLANGESRKEILARSRGLLFKFPTQWTKRQETRAKILFAEYPEIKQAYDLIVRFRNIYNLKDREEATHALNTWKNDISASELDELKNFASTVDTHQGEILSYFG